MFEPVDQLAEIARSAEQLGFEGLALADHVAVPARFESVHPSGQNPFTPESEFTEPLTVVPALAAVTQRLRFMSYVYVLPMREPLLVAKQVGTIASLFPGRFCFGVGAGWLVEELAVLGVDPATRGRRMDEMLDVLRQAWSDGWVEHHGALLDIDRVGLFPVPAEPPPVWVGGRSDAALRRAVRQDGWLGMNYDLSEVERLLDRLHRIRDEAGDDRDDFEVFVIPNAAPSRQLLDDLAGWGVTSTMVMPWAPGDPSVGELAAKRDAMAALAGELGLA
jgi:probable F420-dependent oxidoreductase